MTPREEFEAEAIKRGISVVRSACNYMFANGARTAEGDYFEPAQTAWLFWQASREALAITLPNQYDPIYQEYFDDVDGGCFNYSKYLNDVRSMLAAAGLKVTP